MTRPRINSSILHITPYYKPAWIYGGPIQSISRLAEEQALLGASISVYTTTANGASTLAFPSGQTQQNNGVKVVYFSNWKIGLPFFSPLLIRRLWRAVKENDVIHIHTWWNLVAILAVLVCRLRGVRPVFSPRGMLSAYSLESGQYGAKHAFQLLLGKWLLRGTVLHATSDLEQKECQAIIPNWVHFTLPNILDLPDEEESFIAAPHDASKFRLLFLSRIHPKKGLELLFDALSALSFPWELHIAGEGEAGYVAALQSLAQEKGIQENLHWLGWVDSGTRYALIAEFDLLVLPSQNENFANVVIEALSVGTPVLISEKVGLQDYVVAQNLGWVVPLSVAAITEGLVQAQAAQAHRAWVRAQGPGIIRRDFAAQAVAEKYLEAYRRVKG